MQDGCESYVLQMQCDDASFWHIAVISHLLTNWLYLPTHHRKLDNSLLPSLAFPIGVEFELASLVFLVFVGSTYNIHHD